ncbi:MBL fold metallo-hydrolase [Microbacteriaceae bacterium VKM Ac-2855]|nr:MBL fold metallo-hydrolase [Microbacteriaceae bacterium VKM Ac-2855]
MREITPGVRQLEKSVAANGYVVDLGGHLAVIDPGLRPGLTALIAEVIGPQPVTAILLTHYDVDHAGAATGLQAATGAPVFLGAADIPILRREAKPSTVARRVLHAVGRVTPPRELLPITADGEVVPGIHAIATPGHTPGHFAFLAHGVLFVGDAASTDATGVPAPFASWLHTDTAEAARSLEQLRRLDVEWIAPGHGDVVPSAPTR